MPSVLICVPEPLIAVLRLTVLWRDDVERRVVTRGEDVPAAVAAARPDLVAVAVGFAGSEQLVADLRADPATRRVSIAVIATGEFDPVELKYIEAGANTILRPPAGPEWDERLSALLYVPPRRAGRLAVELQFELTDLDGVRTIAGTILNLSEHGMLVETDVTLPMGADIDFKIHLHDSPRPLVGCGQIVRQEGPRRCGVRFYGLEADGPGRVAKFVNG